MVVFEEIISKIFVDIVNWGRFSPVMSGFDTGIADELNKMLSFDALPKLNLQFALRLNSGI